MNCPTCSREMRRVELFSSVEHECVPCKLGLPAPRPRIGYVVLDYSQMASVIAQPLRQMVFKHAGHALNTATRIAGSSARPFEVVLPREPEWMPRKLRPDELVAWVVVRSEGNRLIGDVGG